MADELTDRYGPSCKHCGNHLCDCTESARNKLGAALARIAERDKRIAELERIYDETLSKLDVAQCERDVALARIAELAQRQIELLEAIKTNRFAKAFAEGLGDVFTTRIARLEEALRFYAKKQNWVPDPGLADTSDVGRDSGKRARQALADKGEG